MHDDVIDRQALARLLDVIGGDTEDLRELLDEFEQTTPSIVETMAAAARSGDLGALRITAHSLKSNAADMGATALSALCATLEAAARDGTVEGAEARVETISSELSRARAALAEIDLANG